MQDDHLADRPVSKISFEGLGRVSEQKIWNNIRSTVGGPYDPKTARGDVERLTVHFTAKAFAEAAMEP